MWRWYAREIEADLARFYRIDIRDWFDGSMESRRLLTLLDGLPDDSSFHRWAIRGGDWSHAEYVSARLVNEMALARADGKGYTPNLLRSPIQVADDNAQVVFRRRRHDETLKELTGKEDHGDHG